MSRPTRSLKIRRFKVGDEADLHRVFFTSVHQIASLDYTPTQISAWAPAEPDMLAWGERLRRTRPFIVVLGDEPIAYADVQCNGDIDHFFVSPAHARQGVGSRLMAKLQQEASSLGLETLSAEVSKSAEAFFHHHGFQVIARRRPTRRGVVIENALMRKAIQKA